MEKFLAVIIVFILSASCIAQEYSNMTHEEIISESQLCGQSNFQEGNCLQKSNCVFMHWHMNSLNEMLRLCMSYNEIMKYYIKSPSEYLRSVGVHNHITINKSNFCDVIDDNKKFMGVDGAIKRCIVSTV